MNLTPEARTYKRTRGRVRTPEEKKALVLAADKAWNEWLSSGKLLIAPVIEYGRGSYDSYLDNGTHGDGDAHFWGAGLMAKQLNDDGLYYEEIGRASCRERV